LVSREAGIDHARLHQLERCGRYFRWLQFRHLGPLRFAVHRRLPTGKIGALGIDAMIASVPALASPCTASGAPVRVRHRRPVAVARRVSGATSFTSSSNFRICRRLLRAGPRCGRSASTSDGVDGPVHADPPVSRRSASTDPHRRSGSPPPLARGPLEPVRNDVDGGKSSRAEEPGAAMAN